MFYGRYYYIITVKEGSIPSRPIMRLQPLTIIFIGLFCCSLGFNFLQIKDYLGTIQQYHKTIIIIMPNTKSGDLSFPKHRELLMQNSVSNKGR